MATVEFQQEINRRYPWLRKGGSLLSLPVNNAAAPDPDEEHRQADPYDVQEAADRSAQGYAPIMAAPQPSGRTRTGNPRTDWMSLVSGMAPSRSSIAQAFPQFAEWYPGSSYEAADLKGPWGWAAPIKGLGQNEQGQAWQWFNSPSRSRSASSSMQSSYAPQFTDPATKAYEALLKQQTSLYQQQQKQMQDEALRQQGVRQQTDEAVKRLLGYVNQRVDTLGKPAYSDAEMNVFQTRALDPMERDRTAANKRALENIGSKGYDPSSGIAQELLAQVNRGFDEDRAATQNELGYRQIQEQRSRDQEKQSLLQYAAEAPMAAARGDLDFVSYLNQLINAPGRDAMGTSEMLANLPVQRTQLAAQVLGLGGQPNQSINGLLALLQNAQQNRYQNQNTQSNFWRNIGLSF